jgi:ribosomal protein L13
MESILLRCLVTTGCTGIYTLPSCALQVVGRLAAQVSKILQGKDKPTYTPSRDLGDVCVIINAERAVLTGRKWDDKVYKRHTGMLIAPCN